MACFLKTINLRHNIPATIVFRYALRGCCRCITFSATKQRASAGLAKSTHESCHKSLRGSFLRQGHIKIAGKERVTIFTAKRDRHRRIRFLETTWAPVNSLRRVPETRIRSGWESISTRREIKKLSELCTSNPTVLPGARLHYDVVHTKYTTHHNRAFATGGHIERLCWG